MIQAMVLVYNPTARPSFNTTTVTAPMAFVSISATTFQMGSPAGENGRQPHPESDQSVESDEMQFTVTLTQDYYLSTTEITRELFFSYMPEDQEGFANCLDADCPIQFISWNMATKMANLLSKDYNLPTCYRCEGEGRDSVCVSKFAGKRIYECPGFRLPTEAEWELAARAGTTDVAIWTPSGGAELPEGIEFECADHILSDGTQLGDIGWFCGVTDRAQPVGQLMPNSFGLYDMSGNVWEWVHDGYQTYPDEATTNYVGEDNGLHPTRGGRWGNEPYALRAAQRIHNEADYWDGNYGFRLAISAINPPTWVKDSE